MNLTLLINELFDNFIHILFSPYSYFFMFYFSRKHILKTLKYHYPDQHHYPF